MSLNPAQQHLAQKITARLAFLLEKQSPLDRYQSMRNIQRMLDDSDLLPTTPRREPPELFARDVILENPAMPAPLANLPPGFNPQNCETPDDLVSWLLPAGTMA
jgi:hypothetical protein